MSEVKDIKEVRKEAIKQLREITELSKDEIKNGDEITAILDNFDLASLIVALDYIEELEKDVTDAMDGYQDLGKDLAFKFVSKEDIKEYTNKEIWLCEHDIDACGDDELEIRKHFVERKKVFEEVQNKLLGE